MTKKITLVISVAGTLTTEPINHRAPKEETP